MPECLPADKLSLVQMSRRIIAVMMVGDGVNGAPGTLGSRCQDRYGRTWGNDASESADAVLFDDISKTVEAIRNFSSLPYVWRYKVYLSVLSSVSVS